MDVELNKIIFVVHWSCTQGLMNLILAICASLFQTLVLNYPSHTIEIKGATHFT